jgi:hypothetical protein
VTFAVERPASRLKDVVVALPPAHLGHLLIDVPLFLGPIVLLIAGLAIHSAHQRRHGDTGATK